MDPELSRFLNHALVKIEWGIDYSRQKIVDGICFGIKAFAATCIGLPYIAIGGEKAYRDYSIWLRIVREVDKGQYRDYRTMLDRFREIELELDRHGHLDDRIRLLA